MLAKRQGVLRKVAAIFEAFDADRDAKLNKAELMALIQKCNPSVPFSEAQLDAITREVLEQYEGGPEADGLTRHSLVQLYTDGVGDCELDFCTLRLSDCKSQQQDVQDTAGSFSTPQKDGFASLFDSPLWSGPAQSLSSQNSFSFSPQGGSHDENAVPNVSRVEACQQAVKAASTAAPQAAHTLSSPASGGRTPLSHSATATQGPLESSLQDNLIDQGSKGCRHRAPWRADAPVQPFPQPLQPLSAEHDADTTEQACEALVDELKQALQQDSGRWQVVAEDLRQQADQLDSADCYDAHMEMGTLLMSSKHHQEAAKSFQHAVTAAAGDARPLFCLGNALFAVGQLSEAQTALRQALDAAISPDDDALLPKIHVNLGISIEASGQLQAACQHYREALQLSPQHFRAFKLLGSALYASGELQVARAALQSALQLKPDYADAHCDLGCVLCALGEVDRAKEAFADAAKFNPKHIEALFNLGNLHRQSSHYLAAIQCYDSVLSLNSQHWRSLLNKAVALTGMHEDRAAQLALKQAYQISGTKQIFLKEVASLSRMAQPAASQGYLLHLLASETTPNTMTK